MTVDDIFTRCQNVDYEAHFVLFDRVYEFSARGRPVFRGTWEDMPERYAKAHVAKFSVEDGGETVYVWVIPIS